MSLYNMVAGVSPAAGAVLGSLGLDPAQIDRFRDADIVERDGAPVFQILARTGGGNREDYPNTALTSHALYLGDEDDDYDSTYAHYYFTITDEVKVAIAAAGVKLDDLIERRTLKDKFDAAIAALKATT